MKNTMKIIFFISFLSLIINIICVEITHNRRYLYPITCTDRLNSGYGLFKHMNGAEIIITDKYIRITSNGISELNVIVNATYYVDITHSEKYSTISKEKLIESNTFVTIMDDRFIPDGCKVYGETDLVKLKKICVKLYNLFYNSFTLQKEEMTFCEVRSSPYYFIGDEIQTAFYYVNNDEYNKLIESTDVKKMKKQTKRSEIVTGIIIGVILTLSILLLALYGRFVYRRREYTRIINSI